MSAIGPGRRGVIKNVVEYINIFIRDPFAFLVQHGRPPGALVKERVADFLGIALAIFRCIHATARSMHKLNEPVVAFFRRICADADKRVVGRQEIIGSAGAQAYAVDIVNNVIDKLEVITFVMKPGRPHHFQIAPLARPETKPARIQPVAMDQEIRRAALEIHRPFARPMDLRIDDVPALNRK